MATRTSSQSGNWSSTSTWGGEAVPANGDTVIISTGHDVVFDVNQSGFANGLLSMVVNGTLRFKVDAVTYLKMNGNITGTGELYVGNSEVDPIQRPPSGTESRCTLMFNATGTIDVPVIRMYGWYPEREYTQLDADAELNATEILLKEDLGLQAGDKIAIGSGTEYGMPAETGRGVYTVQSYDTQTKIVTLTSGLLKERLEEDYVCIGSRPIKLLRSAVNNNGFVTVAQNMICKGLEVVGYFIYGVNLNPPSGGHLFEHCTSSDKLLGYVIYSSVARYCTRVGGASSELFSGVNNLTENCISISGGTVNFGTRTQVKNCITQNNFGLTTGKLVKNSVFKNVDNKALVYKSNFVNCRFLTKAISELSMVNKSTGGTYCKFINCVFEDNDEGYFQNSTATLYNCFFEGIKEALGYNAEEKDVTEIIESFDHNQIPGNYKAWMRGGRIITEDNKLKFICESADAPVFKDYPILAPSNRTIKQLIALTKDTPGIVTNLQIIDPANDPLIDTTATPLAEATAQDTIDNQQIGVAYKSGTPRQLILRILCQNSSGEVLVDTTRIDQSLVKKITSLN